MVRCPSFCSFLLTEGIYHDINHWGKICVFFRSRFPANLSERWRSQNSDFTKLPTAVILRPHLLKHTNKVQFLHKAFTTFLKIQWLVPPVRMQLYTPPKKDFIPFLFEGERKLDTFFGACCTGQCVRVLSFKSKKNKMTGFAGRVEVTFPCKVFLLWVFLWGVFR